MAATTIELECPQCQTMLELDAGFAGGVCRCSNCGTLMTVPADPAHERAERLSRGARPEAPGVAAGASAPARPAAPARPDAPPAAAAPPSEPAPTPAEEEVYTTDSGRTVRITRATRVPTARRRKEAMRFGVILLFVMGTAALLVVCFLAIQVLLRDPDRTRQARQQEAITEAYGGYDPDANPFLLDRPNVLGLPPAKRTAVLIDASSAGRSWLPLVKDAVAVGLSQGRESDRPAVQVLFATEDGPTGFPPEPKRLGEAELAALAAFLEAVPALGSAQPAPAVEAALAGEPDQIVLVTGQPPSEEEAAAVAAAIGARDLRLDVVLVSDESPALRALAEKTGGRYVTLPQSRLVQWYRDMEDRQAREAEEEPE